ncbi:serine hydrolase [Pontibacillus salipaludis]|uniref:Serine hydrolase n=1 Tax=Pontibacillus salipaludis TaxID=1697394 RepID=A0ABQ1Q0M0_9BACI|nr:serine hydrolase [Pontibacillus salipaludis]GGD09431.1 serine hydrolase [Pontibacillus salipaludis]
MNSIHNKIDNLITKTTASASVSILFNNRSIVSINHNHPFRAASIIKVPIMMEAFRQDRDGLLNLDDPHPISPSESVGGAGVIHYLSGQQNYTLRQLIELMIIVSDNTAANLVLKAVGMESVNSLMKQLDCQDSALERFFMDHSAIEKGFENRTTAQDMMTCFLAINEPHPLFTKEEQKTMRQILYNQQFKDMLGSFTSSKEIEIFHKTGELEGAQHDVGVFKYRSETVYAAVLTDDLARNQEGRELIASIGQLVVDHLLDD